MRNNTTLVIWLCGIALIIFLLSRCPHGTNNFPTVISTSDTITETDYRTDTTFIPTPGPAYIDTQYIEIPANVDTAEIIRNYFTKYIAFDTIADTSLWALVIDTIEENQIIGRSFSYRWLQPTTINKIVNNTTIINSKARLYLGVNFSYINNKAGITPSIMFTPKENRHGFLLGFDVLNKGMMAGYHYNILKP